MALKVNDQITMELLQMEHAPALFALVDSNRAYLREWLPWLDRTNSIADVEEFIRTMMRQYDSGHGPHFVLYFGGAICGVTGFHKIDKYNRLASLGYWLAESCMGKGIMTMATRELLKIGFGKYDLNKIEIHCAVGNARSRAIPERLGFTCEATLRQREWLYNRFVDHAIYSLLASAYITRP